MRVLRSELCGIRPVRGAAGILAALALLALLPRPGARCAEATPDPYPPTDAAWTSQEYAKAYLQMLKSARAGQALLTLDDADGRRILGRIASPENLAPLADAKLTVEKRMSELLGIFANAGGMHRLYAGEILAGRPAQREYLALQVFMLRLVTPARRVSDEYLKSLPPDHADAKSRREFASNTNRTFLTMTTAAFAEACKEQSALSDELVLGYFRDLREVLPALVTCLDIRTQEALVAALAGKVRSAKGEALRKAAAELLDIARSGSPGFPGSPLIADVQRQFRMLDRTGLQIESAGAAPAAAPQWARHQSAGGRFSVELPVRPVALSGRTGEKGDGTVQLLQIQDRLQVRYLAACGQSPASAGRKDAELLDGFFEKRPEDVRNPLTDRRAVEWEGHKGYEFRVESETSAATGRAFVVGGRTYLLCVEHPKALAEDSAKDVQRFLASLKREGGR